jgi:hypothetical protein
LLHARVRHHTMAVLRPSRARSSLGLLPSRGVPLTGMAWLSPCLPSRACSAGRKSDLLSGSSGYQFQRGRLISLETAAPPGLLPPSDRHNCSGRTPARESPPQASGCVTVPSTSHL